MIHWFFGAPRIPCGGGWLCTLNQVGPGLRVHPGQRALPSAISIVTPLPVSELASDTRGEFDICGVCRGGESKKKYGGGWTMYECAGSRLSIPASRPHCYTTYMYTHRVCRSRFPFIRCFFVYLLFGVGFFFARCVSLSGDGVTRVSGVLSIVVFRGERERERRLPLLPSRAIEVRAFLRPGECAFH